MLTKRITPNRVLLAVLTLLAPIAPAAAQDLLWARQFGTSEDDSAWRMAVDGTGNAYITGTTEGNLGGHPAGQRDAFLAKYDESGVLLWMRQFGTPEYEWPRGVAADGAGNAYIAGATRGGLGGSNAGSWDVFLAKYDASGAPLWTRQFGTLEADLGLRVDVDSTGNAYISGITEGSLGGPNAGSLDAFLAKYDASGTLLWMRQIGTESWDSCYGVAVDSVGNAYIAGSTLDSLGGPSAGEYDVFLVKYDATGALLWTRQFGTPMRELVYGVAVDGAGNAYITGYTWGSLGGPNVGKRDIFLVKYDATGNLRWTRQIGTPFYDWGRGVAADSAGNAYITGSTEGKLGGSNAGDDDAILIKYSSSGSLLWKRQLGTLATDLGMGVAVDNARNVYIAGSTKGSLGAPNAGKYDLFLAKFKDAPCYADCDQSTGIGVLDVFDFLCFQNSFVVGEPYACDCDTSTGLGVCDIFDFLCFQNTFVAGCP